MRLLQRTLSEIRVWPRREAADGLGGVREEFSGEPQVLSGNIGYVSNTLNSTANALMSTEAGMRAAQTLRLRFMGDAGIDAGDGAALPGEARACWRCVEVSRYPLMTVARIERMAAEYER